MEVDYNYPASVTLGEYRVLVSATPPMAADSYWQNAGLSDRLDDAGDSYAFVAIQGRDDEHPSLVVSGRFHAAGGLGPGVLVVPETTQVFVGAGTTLTAYDRRSGVWQRTWRDEAEFGFWCWARHGDVVLMSAELELAAWTANGQKLWTRFVEPPWSFTVIGLQVRLDVMGHVTSFPITGPPS